MNSNGRVLVAGSINMDIVATVPRHPAPGETLSGSNLGYFPGGKGANQAVAAGRAGGAVEMIGAVGDDAFGPDLLKFLADNGVDTRQVKVRSSMPTGTALILVDMRGENMIVVVPGANGTLAADDVRGCAPHVGDVLLAQYETPIAATLAFFGHGLSANATRILNPAPADIVSTALLRLVDILVVNETELALVSGCTLSDVPSQSDIEEASARLSELGFAGTLVATLGERGAIAVSPSEGVTVVPGRTVDAVDTTGAGDCFVGYLASSIAHGYSFGDALIRANVAASISVQRPGAGPSMPFESEVDEELSLAPS